MLNNRKLYDFIIEEFNSLRISVNEKFTSLNIAIREYYNSLIDRLGPISEDVTAIKDQFGLIMHKLDKLQNGISFFSDKLDKMQQQIIKFVDREASIWDDIGSMWDDILGLDTLSKEQKQTLLMVYEDLSKFQRDSNKDSGEIKERVIAIHDLIKEMTRKEYDYIEGLKAENQCLREQINDLTGVIADNKQNAELVESLKSLESSFAIVTQGVYNQDNIEFAAVKTYREGWKYLCYNGRQLTNFDGISNISLNWYSDEKFINMDISFTGE